MPQSRRPSLAAALAGAAVALVALPACGGGGGGSSTTIAGMLDRVPSNRYTRGFVQVDRYDVAWKASGLDRDATGAELTRNVLKLTTDVKTGIGLQPTPILGATTIRPEQLRSKVGYAPGDVTADIQAGTPPHQYLVGVGTFDGDAVAKAVRTTVGKAAKERDLAGTEVTSWLGDQQIDMGSENPFSSVPRSGRVAVQDGELVYAAADREVEELLEPGKTLADDQDLVAAAQALDDREVHAAILSGVPLTVGGLTRATPSIRERLEETALPPYVAYGIGAAKDGGTTKLVVALVAEDGEAATTLERGLRRQVERGTSAATGQAWKTLLRDPDLTVDGRVVTGTFTVENPTLWSRIVQQRDTLLLASGR